jgi:hypothetical protein
MFGALEALSFEHLMQWLDHLVKCFDRGEATLNLLAQHTLSLVRLLLSLQVAY